MWNGNLHPYPNNNNSSESDGGPSLPMDTDQLDAVSALTALQGAPRMAFPPPYFVDPSVAANGAAYFPPMFAVPSAGTVPVLYRPLEELSESQPHPTHPPELSNHAALYAPPDAPVESNHPIAHAEEEDEDSAEEEDEDAAAIPVAVVPRGKPEAARVRSEEPPKKAPRKTSSSSPKKKKKATMTSTTTAAVSSDLLVAEAPAREFLLGEPVPRISEAEYDNLTELMQQFCKVPLLAEFRRPVAILHPEVRMKNHWNIRVAFVQCEYCK